MLKHSKEDLIKGGGCYVKEDSYMGHYKRILQGRREIGLNFEYRTGNWEYKAKEWSEGQRRENY